MSIIEQLPDALRRQIHAHAGREQPRECCGLLVRATLGGGVVQGLVDGVELLAGPGELMYVPARNVFPQSPGGYQQQDRFRLHPEDWAMAEDFGDIVAVVHSHPHASANPSMADRVGCEASGVPWVIMGWPSGVLRELHPEGWQAPYEGRDFAHGVLDCYTVIQDWYRRELGEVLPEFDRPDEWWVRRAGQPGQDLYRKHFAEAGFSAVRGVPRRHDVIVMQVHADQANHGAVYLGDGRMLHHLFNRRSAIEVYGGYWQRHTALLLRHRSQWLASEAAAAVPGLVAREQAA